MCCENKYIQFLDHLGLLYRINRDLRKTQVLSGSLDWHGEFQDLLKFLGTVYLL